MDTGILIIRLFFGLAIAAHGAQKLFGWFGGHGIKATGSMFESIGFRPGAVFATAAGLTEMGGRTADGSWIIHTTRGCRRCVDDARRDDQRSLEERLLCRRQRN